MKIPLIIPGNMVNSISQESYIDDTSIVIKFGDKFSNKEIKSPFDLKDIPNSLSRLEQELKQILNLSNHDYNQIEYMIQESIRSINVEDCISLEPKKNKQIITNKYSQNRRGSLYEAVLVKDEPFFVTLDQTNQIAKSKLVKNIVEASRTLIPPTIDEYLSEPYIFESQQEIDYYLGKARKETIFSLYKKAKSIVSKYIDQESYIHILISINIVYSYFQDRFSTVHYVGIFGGNGNGKSSIGDTFEAVAYRSYNTTDPTPANIFRSLGNVEPGQMTLVLDESERIDQNPDMMSILKTGYDIRKTVSRVNQFTGQPEKFNAYCIKMIIGERPPSPNTARGVNDRILGDMAFYGSPPYDIKEVLNPTDTGGQELKELLAEIKEHRKTMFAFRLLHFRDHIPNIDIDQTGRNKELVKPYLQLFSSFKTEEEKQIFGEIKNAFTKLLDIKNQKNQSTIEYALIPLILILMEQSKTRQPIKFSDLWDLIKSQIKGQSNEYKPNEYNTEDYGTIYRNTITSILHKLGVRTKRHNSYVELLFDQKKIKKIAGQYGFAIQEKIDNNSSERSERSEGSLHPATEEINGESKNNVEIEPYNDDTRTKNNINDSKNNETSNISKSSDPNNIGYIDRSTHSIHSIHPDNTLENKPKRDTYRIGNTDIIGCHNCKMTGDRWFMQDHPCKGNSSTIT
jgi:hypothetical protein